MSSPFWSRSKRRQILPNGGDDSRLVRMALALPLLLLLLAVVALTMFCGELLERAATGQPAELGLGAIYLLAGTFLFASAVMVAVQSLRVAGKLAACEGIALGAMVGCDDARHPDWTVERIVAECAEALGLPLVTGLPFGHVEDNRAWTLGARAALDPERGTLAQLESGVSRRS